MQWSVRPAVSKARCVLLAFCLLGVSGATPASADIIMNYSLTGTGDAFVSRIDGDYPTSTFTVAFSGSFTYRIGISSLTPGGTPVETPSFDRFSVTIVEHQTPSTLDLTDAMNTPIITGGGPACLGGKTGPAASQLMLTVCGPQNPQVALWAMSFDGPTGVTDFRLGYPWLRGLSGTRLSDTSVSGRLLRTAPAGDLVNVRGVYVGTWQATLESLSTTNPPPPVAPPPTVPEPSVLALAATAAAACVCRARRRTAGAAVTSGQPAGPAR